MSPRFPARLAATLALLTLVQCQCRENPVNKADACRDVPKVQADQLGACNATSDCGEHYGCLPVKDVQGLSCCVKEDRKCSTEAECCPGQTCVGGGRCFDKFMSCTTDADCGERSDLFCEPWTDFFKPEKPELRCRFKTCGAGGACPEGQSCFQNECMVELPCGGTCAAGEGCVPSGGPNGRCQAFACPASCAPGFIATFKDSRNLWDTCTLAAVGCECAELPRLQSYDFGRYSALSADAPKGELLVSAYDGQYGDLVMSRYDAKGTLAERRYVDGVPATGEVKYGPSGPRGGVVDLGDDVGRYSDTLVVGANAFVSYYDATHGDLKLAVREGAQWKSFRVDGATADVGLFTSLAADADGLLGIAYYQRGGDAGFDASGCPGGAPAGDRTFLTALKLARAKVPAPASAADFVIKTLACQTRPTPPCHACAEICADPGTGPTCLAAGTGCTGCDVTSQTCVRVGAVSKCAANFTPPNLAELEDGVGLFSALAFKGRDAYIAFMKRTEKNGDLYGVRVTSTGTLTAPVLLDASGDTGYFPDLTVDPVTGALQIAYHDFSSRQLKFYTAPTLSATVTPEVIDRGLGSESGDVRWSGADVTLLRTPAGQLFAIYQDSTASDLKLAVRRTGWVTLPPLRTEGAVGFFADGAFLKDQLFISHARIHARKVGVTRVDNSLLLEKYPSP